RPALAPFPTRRSSDLRLRAAEFVPGRVVDSRIHGRAHCGGILGREKESVRPDELEGIPLDRVVAGGYRQAACGVMVLHRQLHGGDRKSTRLNSSHVKI